MDVATPEAAPFLRTDRQYLFWAFKYLTRDFFPGWAKYFGKTGFNALTREHIFSSRKNI
jgi:hypothetical protein